VFAIQTTPQIVEIEEPTSKDTEGWVDESPLTPVPTTIAQKIAVVETSVQPFASTLFRF